VGQRAFRSARRAQSIISVPIYSQKAYFLVMRTRTIVAIIAAVIIVIAIVGAAFLLTLQAPQVQGVSVSSIDNVSRSGFTLTFVIKLYNPNVVGVNIKAITYNLLLTSSNQVLSTGTSDGIQIPARGSVDIPIQSTIYFGSAISTVLQAILTKSVMMNLNGVVTAHPLIIDVNVSFSQTFDAYPYISSQISKIV
jgi:LEA14-like dessication related protein